MPRKPSERQRFRAAATLAPRYESGVIGLPPGAMVLTNSERRATWCPRRWWFEYGAGLRWEGSPAMRFGTAYHAAAERVLGWFQLHPDEQLPAEGLERCLHCTTTGAQADAGCTLCDGTGLGSVALVGSRMDPNSYAAEDGGVEAEVDRLRRAMHGWLRTYGASMVSDYRVLGVELAVAAPITSPTTNEPYRSRVPVVATEQGWRLAGASDHPSTVQQVLLPWFQVARLDAVVESRSSGNLWLWETKTSASPATYGENLGLDTQLPGYLRALWWLASSGQWGGGRKVEGYVWDVTSSSHQKEPKRLASGKLSTDKRQKVPSWTMDAVMTTEDATRYTANELEGLRELRQHLRESVDGSLYHREWDAYSAQQLRRYEVELYAEAVKLAAWRRAAVGTACGDGGTVTDDEAVAATWPRVPLCRQPGGGCPFTGICLQDSAEGRASYEIKPPVQWLHAAGKQSINQPKPKEVTECPF